MSGRVIAGASDRDVALAREAIGRAGNPESAVSAVSRMLYEQRQLYLSHVRSAARANYITVQAADIIIDCIRLQGGE